MMTAPGDSAKVTVIASQLEQNMFWTRERYSHIREVRDLNSLSKIIHPTMGSSISMKSLIRSEDRNSTPSLVCETPLAITVWCQRWIKGQLSLMYKYENSVCSGHKKIKVFHDDVIKWTHFPRNWPFVRGIHRSRWIPHSKASDAELWCFLWSASE